LRGLGNLDQVETVLAELRAGVNVALMYVCASPAVCHRSTVAAEAVEREPALTVVPL
jgi:hypothetical protein